MPINKARIFFKHLLNRVGERVSRISVKDVSKEVFGVVGVVGCCHLFGQTVLSYSICVGPSMLPTLDSSGNFVFVLPSFYRVNPYKIGDVVLATSPTDPTKIICKRIRGLSGDIILNYPDNSTTPTIHMVPVGYCWLAGDNPHNSTDSRSYGPVPLGLIRGKVWVKVDSQAPFFHKIPSQPPLVLNGDDKETSPATRRRLTPKYVRTEENKMLCDYTIEENQSVRGAEAMELKRAIFDYIFRGDLPEYLGRKIVDALIDKEEDQKERSFLSRMISFPNNNNNNNNDMIVIEQNNTSASNISTQNLSPEINTK